MAKIVFINPYFPYRGYGGFVYSISRRILKAYYGIIKLWQIMTY
jgi:hypothetical protein